MKLEVKNIKGEVLKEVDVSAFNIENIRHDLIHQIVVWQLAKRREVISNVKKVSDVKGSTRKIYRQKGTGRARHGSLKRNLFRGGGITFGPTKEKRYDYKLNKKVRKLCLFNTLITQSFSEMDKSD